MSRTRPRTAALITLTAALALALPAPSWGTPGSCTLPLLPGAGGLADTWIVDGDGVSDVVIADGIAYVGGSIEVVGPPTGPAAEIDLGTGTVTAAIPMITGPNPRVTAVAADGDGGWYLAGNFTAVGGAPRNGLVRVLADGSVDPTFDPGLVGYNVEALVLADGVLYAGGDFTTIGGASRADLAALDPVTGAATDWNPAPNDQVYAIAVQGSTVFVGGRFSSVGGQSRSRVAALDAGTGAATTWTASVGGTTVEALAVDGSTLFVGGRFTTIGGSSRMNLAAVDVTTGAVDAWDPGLEADVNQPVISMVVHDGTLYVVGRFLSLDGGTTRRRGGAFDIATGDLTAWDPDLDGHVWTVAASATSVFVGGTFDTAGGAPRLNLAAVDPITGAAQAMDLPASGIVHATAMDGDRLLVGGSFAALGGVRRWNLAAFDLTTGALTDWAPVVDDNEGVHAMAASGGALYLGGEFTTVNGDPRSNLAAVDLATGATLPWDPGAGGVVTSLVMDGASTYVGGWFSTVGGQARSFLAEVDTGSGAVTAWAPAAAGEIIALGVGATVVYTGVDANPSAVAFDRSTGAATAWAPAVSGTVETLLPDGSDVLLGGFFDQVDGQTRWGLAEVDGGTGAVTGWDAALAPFSSVRDLSVDGSSLFLAGYFAFDPVRRGELEGGVGIAAVDRSSGAAIWTPDALGEGAAVAHTPSVVAVGGEFAEMGRGGLLLYCRDVLFDDGFESGGPGAWSAVMP